MHRSIFESHLMLHTTKLTLITEIINSSYLNYNLPCGDQMLLFAVEERNLKQRLVMFTCLYCLLAII